ncbi:hypothetical protein T265_02089 [Opisthorchis viverrini]|uniref:Uncharacterized protein n=1 Tax=Opisthorchis viverrini TaxID=6198 RepID=A0A074ZXB9_OPIVI|nr:hypothetical protein T265_02089 [Opisthorchis viverrini]KER31721.1 hypothetical protein T265_02089 [Opisthorchis viverrini]
MMRPDPLLQNRVNCSVQRDELYQGITSQDETPVKQPIQYRGKKQSQQTSQKPAKASSTKAQNAREEPDLKLLEQRNATKPPTECSSLK